MDITSPKKKYHSKPVIITLREPKCTRCRNHGMIAKMKGHKGSCPYALCSCLKCILVEERRRISRQQIRLRRHGNIDIQELLECASRNQSSSHQGNNVSPNSLISNEPNPIYPTMNWPVNFAVGPPQPNPSCVYSTPPPSDLSHYHPSQNLHNPASCNPSSGSSMVPDNHGSNLYYPPNKLSDFSRPYAHSSSGYQLAPTTSQSFPYKGFNNGSAASCSRSWFFNTVSYNLNPMAQRFAAGSRFGSACQGPHCSASLTGTGSTDTPTDLTENAPVDADK